MSSSRSSLITEPEHWTESELVVDRHDPFFFDHPLDHVPGTLQLFALLDMVRASTGYRLGSEAGTRLRMRVDFPAFCEFDAGIRLGCSETPSGEADGKRRSWSIRAEQNGQTSCVGSIEVEFEAEPAAPADPHDESVAAGDARNVEAAGGAGNRSANPVPGCQVHRVNPENIMIGTCATENGERVEAPVLEPPSGHFLSLSGADERGPELLIEAVRQFTVYVEYLLSAQRGQSQMLLRSISADFPCGIFDRPLSLCAMERVHGSRLTSQKVGILGSRGREVLGTFSIAGRAVSEPVYNRIRGHCAAG